MSRTTIDPSLDYKSVEVNNGSYRHMKFIPESGQSNVLITASGAESMIKIPPICFNLAKSILEFDLSIAAQGVGNFTFVHKDCMSLIRQLQVYTQDGVMLADIRNLHNYTKAQWMLEPAQEYLEYDTHGNAVGVAYGAGRMLRRANAALGAGGSTNCTVKPYSGNGVTIDGTAPFFEKQYVEVTSLANAAFAMSVRLPLEMIRNSILALNKSICIGQSLYIRIYWAPTNKIAFTSTNIAQPGTNILSLPTAQISLTNLSLLVAEEIDPSVCSTLTEKARSGYSLLTPWIEGGMVPLTGTLQVPIIQTNPGMGKRLQRCIFMPLNQTEQNNTAYDNHQDGVLINAIYTDVDSHRLEPFNVSLANPAYEDWALIKNKLRGGIAFDSQIYRANWFWLMDFCKFPSPSESVCNALHYNEEKGLDLSVPHVLRMNAFGTNNGFNWYYFMITQREVEIKNNKVSIH